MQQFDAHDYPTSGHQYQEPFRPNQHSFENIPQQNQFTSPINNQAMNYYGSGYRPNNPNPNSYSYQNTPFIRPIYRAPPTENAFNCNNEQRLRMNAPINPVPRGFLPQFPNQLHPPQHNSSQMNFGAPNMGSNRSIEPPIYRPEFQWNNVQNQEFNTQICGFSAENEECNSNTASFERESMTDISKSTLSKKRNLENDEWVCNWIILVEKREDREKEERKKTSELKKPAVLQEIEKQDMFAEISENSSDSSTANISNPKKIADIKHDDISVTMYRDVHHVLQDTILPYLDESPIKTSGLTSQKQRKGTSKLNKTTDKIKISLESAYGNELPEAGTSKKQHHCEEEHHALQKYECLMRELKDKYNTTNNYKLKLQILTLSPFTIERTPTFFETFTHMVKKSRHLKKQHGILPEISSMSKGKISDIQKKLLTYASLVSELDEVLKEFSSCNESDHENWEILYKKAEDLKEEIRLLKDFFGDEKKVREIKEMLTKRRGRRGRVRKVKKEKARKRRRMKEEWKEKEKEIDHRLNQLHEEEKAKISEGKMKKEADAILREVTTKQEEAHRMRKLLEALTKLREARIKKGEMHGYVASPQASAFFAKLKGEFGKLLADQLDLYRAEEQTLRVMMEESKNTLSRSSFKRLNRTPKVEKIQKQIYEILFGEKILPEHQNEFQRSFTSADESIEILVKRRFDWDQFLVSEDTPSGSSVPIGWVVPNGDSNSDWKTFQQN